MKNNVRKISFVFLMALILGSLGTVLSPVLSASELSSELTNEEIVDSSAGSTLDQLESENFYDISTLFVEDVNGQVSLKTTHEELVSDFGFSNSEASELLAFANDIDQSDMEVEPTNSMRGFVGIRVYFGPRVRNMNGWAAGTFVAGYVGWYAKELAAAGPVGAGAAALITGSTFFIVKNAVSKGWRSVSIGQNIPGFSLSFRVYTP